MLDEGNLNENAFSQMWICFDFALTFHSPSENRVWFNFPRAINCVAYSISSVAETRDRAPRFF